MTETDDPRLETVRTNLRMACAMRGLNFSEVARKADLSRNALSQFISGSRSMLYGNLLRICDVLDIPIGLLHRPDAITSERIRLYRVLESMPDHLAGKALREAQEISGR